MYQPPKNPRGTKLTLQIPTKSNEESHNPFENQLAAFLHADVVSQMTEADWLAASRNGDIQEIRYIGEGSGGAVRLCQLRGHNRQFALKEISANPSTELQKQVLRELQFNKTCDSPFIVKYYGAYLQEEVGSIFIAMEYCQGRSLDDISRQVRSRNGRIGEKVLARIALCVLEGISYLYDRNIIHRDIKPQNILLNAEGQVKLCDFGVSGVVVDSLATTFTGTSNYMAPERIQGQPYTVNADVWSLGLTLLELAMGKFPFKSDSPRDTPEMPIELYLAIVNNPIPVLQDEPERGVKWSESFRHFLTTCLAKEPKNRPTPKQMLAHPWIRGNANKKVDMQRFVKEAWD